MRSRRARRARKPGRKATVRRAIFAEQLSPQGELLYAVVRDPPKLIQQVLPEPHEMRFDIRRDMAERNNLAGEAPDTVRELRGLLSHAYDLVHGRRRLGFLRRALVPGGRGSAPRRPEG